jgi:hypothetical protein
MKKIGVLAGDLRQYYICTYLKEKGYAADYLYEIADKDYYVVPIPF